MASIGASSGITVLWNSSVFTRELIETQVDTYIPKARLFRFGNYLVDLPGFYDCVANSWASTSNKAYSSVVIADKLKSLRFDLKKWHINLSRLQTLIQSCNKVIFLLWIHLKKRDHYIGHSLISGE